MCQGDSKSHTGECQGMKKPTLSDTSSTLRSDAQLGYTPTQHITGTRKYRAGEF